MIRVVLEQLPDSYVQREDDNETSCSFDFRSEKSEDCKEEQKP